MRAGGFTVIELVATLALVAVLGGTAVVRAAAMVDGARLAGGVRVLGTTLRVARSRALAGGGTIEVRFDQTHRTCETRTAAGQTIAMATLPPRVGFVAVPARGRIAFSALGTADNATVTLGVGTRQRSMVVNQRGRVRLS